MLWGPARRLAVPQLDRRVPVLTCKCSVSSAHSRDSRVTERRWPNRVSHRRREPPGAYVPFGHVSGAVRCAVRSRDPRGVAQL